MVGQREEQQEGEKSPHGGGQLGGSPSIQQFGRRRVDEQSGDCDTGDAGGGSRRGREV